MGNIAGIGKETPLAEVLENWRKTDGTAGLLEKQAIALCKEDRPALRGAGVWPREGSFKLKKWTTLQKILEDEKPQKMDYWYVWENWAYDH